MTKQRHISIPLRRGKTGYFARCQNLFQEIEEHLRQILFVNPFERFMRTDIGTPLLPTVFDSVDEVYSGVFETYAKAQIEKWEPRVTITRLDAYREQQTDATVKAILIIQYTHNATGLSKDVELSNIFAGTI